MLHSVRVRDGETGKADEPGRVSEYISRSSHRSSSLCSFAKSMACN